MIATQRLSLHFGKQLLFENVSLRFTGGKCYGLIGPNGAGKSTFLKILSGAIEPSSGSVVVPEGLRVSVLKQDHFAFNEVDALTTVLMGHQRLWAIMQEKDALYAKPDFGDADGVRVAELETEFGELHGWESSAQAGELLCSLGIPVARHATLIRDLDDGDKVRVLLAQAVFAEPDILLLDEPTNHLDVDSILWLEEFLLEFRNTVIIVSHDRHFLNKVCTHIADIDFRAIQLYTGNYDFWKAASEMTLRHQQSQDMRNEEKAKELKAFIARFSANASKARQATSRKKMLADLDVESVRPSSRKYPHVVFNPEKLRGTELVALENLSKTVAGERLFADIRLTITKKERVAVISRNSLAISALLEIIAGATLPDGGSVRWGSSVRRSFLPKDNSALFDVDLNVIDWLRQFSEDQDENFIRTFLGRMLFTGDESKKSVRVLSGGEKVRCMIAKLMLEDPHCLILDGPTNHLDLESITSLNEALIRREGALIFGTHDVEFARTLADRVIEITPETVIDHHLSYEEFLERRADATRLTVGA